MVNYTPFGHSDWQTIVADIKAFGSAGKRDRSNFDYQWRCKCSFL